MQQKPCLSRSAVQTVPCVLCCCCTIQQCTCERRMALVSQAGVRITSAPQQPLLCGAHSAHPAQREDSLSLAHRRMSGVGGFPKAGPHSRHSTGELRVGDQLRSRYHFASEGLLPRGALQHVTGAGATHMPFRTCC